MDSCFTKMFISLPLYVVYKPKIIPQVVKIGILNQSFSLLFSEMEFLAKYFIHAFTNLLFDLYFLKPCL